MKLSLGKPTLAIGLTVSLALSSCSGKEQVLVGDGTRLSAADTAQSNAFGSASQTLEGSPSDGVYLDVEYFEALRKGDWIAPDHCWFATRVSVSEQLSSPGFNGPTSDDDRDAGEGLLVGTIDETADYPIAYSPDTAGTSETTTTSEPEGTDGDQSAETTVTVTPDTTVPAEAEAPDTTVQTETETSEPEMTPYGTTMGEPSHDGSETTVESTTDGTVRSAMRAVVVVFGHDQVVELSLSAPAAIDGFSTEVQPLDGWNVLSIPLNPEADLGETVDVTLERVHEDGTTTSELITIPLGQPELSLMTEDWEFDLDGVDDECAVPSGSTDNERVVPSLDVLGSPIGEAPKLPEPGTPPPDPADAADQALRALRAMYDLEDVYSASKREFAENPEDWERMRQQIMANDIVAPYMSKLDPIFRSAVFVSPTEAHILYRVGPTYQWEIGRVLLIDGTWRVAAGTICRDLSSAGYTCPGVTQDPRPGPIG